MFKLIKNLTKKELIYAIICVTLMTCHVWLELKVPDYMSEITRLVQTEGSKIEERLVAGGFMMLCACWFRSIL